MTEKGKIIIVEDTPGLILMDINLGDGGNGIEIAKKLKKILTVPFVFLSAYSGVFLSSLREITI